MITATVRYKLPPHIDYAACREHFHKIAPGFREVKGLISKHFIWSESGWAGGVYQWDRIEDAKVFYSGPWLDGIVERYGMKPTHEARSRCSRRSFLPSSCWKVTSPPQRRERKISALTCSEPLLCFEFPRLHA